MANNDYSSNTNFPKRREQEHYIASRSKPRTYLLGFFFSIILTVLAYLFVTLPSVTLPRMVAIGVLVWCAIIQIIVQLLFFLHFGGSERPRLKLPVFFVMIIMLVIIVGGSLWIMWDLNAHMMPDPATPMQMNGFTISKQY